MCFEVLVDLSRLFHVTMCSNQRPRVHPLVYNDTLKRLHIRKRQFECERMVKNGDEKATENSSGLELTQLRHVVASGGLCQFWNLVADCSEVS